MTQAQIWLPQEADDYEGASALVSEELAIRYGGYTILTDNEGGWHDGSELIHEPVDIWQVYSTEHKSSVIQHFEKLADYVKELTGEQAIMISVNHDHMLVD